MGDRPKGGPKPFWFFDIWTSYDDFRRVVKEGWDIHIIRNTMFILAQKLKFVKAKLKYWNKTVFGRVDHQVKNLRDELYKI